jgi:hypothetical protein
MPYPTSLLKHLHVRKADKEAECFRLFSQDVSYLKNDTPRVEGVEIVDFKKEMNLLREMKDIIDELETMDMLFSDQENVLQVLTSDRGVEAQQIVRSAVKLVLNLRTEVTAMKDHASNTSKAVS